MSVDLSQKSVLVYDHGVFQPIAHRLARDFGHVYYYVPWKDANMKSIHLRIGHGFDDIERVTDLWDVIDDVDLIVFPDVGDGDFQVWLRDRGYKVFGSLGGDELELERFKLRQLMSKLGMPVIPFIHIRGLDKLASHLEKAEDKWVKLSVLRGDAESFHHINWRITEPRLIDMKNRLGPSAELLEFIVEDSLPDAVEIGYDGYFVAGAASRSDPELGFPRISTMGYEIKDCGYIGVSKPYLDLPKPVRYVNNQIAPTLVKYGYQGLFSTELRVDQDGVPYLIDPTCRAGSPPSELYCEWFTNFSQIVWSAAHGELLEPTPRSIYGAELMIYSDWCDDHWAPVYIPSVIEDRVKLSFAARLDSKTYVVPQSFDWRKIGAVIGFGDTVQSAIADAQSAAKLIEGFELSIPEESMDQAIEQIEKGQSYGIDFEVSTCEETRRGVDSEKPALERS